MKKRVFISIAALGAFVFSGCAQKPIVAFNPNNKSEALVSIRNGSGSPSWGANERVSASNALQVAAETTLKEGKQYFYIIKPDEISNVKGSMMNSGKEFIEKCLPSSGVVLNVGGMGLHKCGISNNTMAKLVIGMSDKKSENIMMYDANEVIAELKAQGLYDEDKKEVDRK